MHCTVNVPFKHRQTESTPAQIHTQAETLQHTQIAHSPTNNANTDSRKHII